TPRSRTSRPRSGRPPPWPRRPRPSRPASRPSARSTRRVGGPRRPTRSASRWTASVRTPTPSTPTWWPTPTATSHGRPRPTTRRTAVTRPTASSATDGRTARTPSAEPRGSPPPRATNAGTRTCVPAFVWSRSDRGRDHPQPSLVRPEATGDELSQRLGGVRPDAHVAPGEGVEPTARERGDELDDVGRLRPLRAALVGTHRGGHVGADDARGELEAPQAAVEPGLVERAADSEQRRLGDVVGGGVGAVPGAGAGVDVDDAPAAALEHAGDDGAGEEERPANVRLDDRPPALGVGLPQRHLGVDDAGVVHEQVDPAELGLGARDGLLDGGAVGNVRGEGDGPHARGADLLGRPLEQAGVPGEERDVEAGLRQADRERAPDPPRGAGDERGARRRDLSHGAPPRPARQR